MSVAQPPVSDRGLLVWGAGVFGLIASMAVLVYGVREGDVIAVAGAIGVAWSAYALVSSFFAMDAAAFSAIVHAMAGVALIIAIGLATGGWMFIAALLVGWLIACAAVWAADHRDAVSSRFGRRKAGRAI